MAHAHQSHTHTWQQPHSPAEQRPPLKHEARSLARILRRLAQDAARHNASIVIPDTHSAQQLLLGYCSCIAPDDWRLTLRWTLTHLARHTAPLKQDETTATARLAHQTPPSASLHNFALGVLAYLDQLA